MPRPDVVPLYKVSGRVRVYRVGESRAVADDRFAVLVTGGKDVDLRVSASRFVEDQYVGGMREYECRILISTVKPVTGKYKWVLVGVRP